VQKYCRPDNAARILYGTSFTEVIFFRWLVWLANFLILFSWFVVVYHHGKYANGGHYTIDVLRQDASEWIRIDDTHIEVVTEADVIAAPGDKKHTAMDKTAYLLFYRRIPMPNPGRL